MRSSSFLSRGDVVGACHTLRRSSPRASKRTAFVSTERSGTQLLAPCQFRFRALEFAQATLPFGFEAAGDQTVVWIDGAITALGALRLVASPARPRDAIAPMQPS